MPKKSSLPNITRRDFLALAAASGLSSLLEGCAGHLVVNTAPHHPKTYDMVREKGERDLVELARTSYVEEAYIYSEEDGLWEEVGIFEQPNQTKIRWPAILKYRGKSVTHYHIHPLTTVWTYLRDLWHKDDEVLDRELFEFVKNEFRAYPSLTDMFRESPQELTAQSNLVGQLKRYEKRLADHRGIIRYTGLIDFAREKLRGIGEAEAKQIHQDVSKAYDIARALTYCFLDEWFRNELMSRLPEKARIRFTEQKFGIAYEDFIGFIEKYKKSPAYFSLVGENSEHTEKRIKWKEEGIDSIKKRFDKYLTEHLG